MKKFLFTILTLSILVLVSCAPTSAKSEPTKYVTIDSSLVFIFQDDTLFVDTYESGCGIEYYTLKLQCETSEGEIVYDAYRNDGTKTIIRLLPNLLSNHYDYWLKIGDEGVIPIVKIKKPNYIDNVDCLLI